jgi:hypothetical protein
MGPGSEIAGSKSIGLQIEAVLHPNVDVNQLK